MVCLGPVSLPFESWVQARAPDSLLTVRSNDQETSTVRSGSSRVSLPVKTGRHEPARLRTCTRPFPPAAASLGPSAAVTLAHRGSTAASSLLLVAATEASTALAAMGVGDECGGHEATCSPHQQHPAAARGGLVLACYPQGSSLPLLLLFLYCPSLRNGCLQDV
jgi:hypothetical protein